MNINKILNKKIYNIIKNLSNNTTKLIDPLTNIENDKYTQNKCIIDIKNNLEKIKQKNNIFTLCTILKNIQNKTSFNIQNNNGTQINNQICSENENNNDNYIENNIKININTINIENNNNNSNITNYKNNSNNTLNCVNTDNNSNTTNCINNNNNSNTTNYVNNDNNTKSDYVNIKLCQESVNNQKNTLFKYKNYYKHSSYIFVNNKIFENIFENHQNIQIKSNEPIVFAICILIYKKFLYLNDSKKNLFIKELKYIMAIDLDRKNLYEKYKYNHKRFKKSEFQNDLIENKIMNNNYFYMYIGDYFNINIIFKDNDQIIYFNNYNSNRYSLLIINYDNDIYVHYNCDKTSLLSHELCIKNNIIININKKTNNYGKLKISELQNIAKSKNIDIKKQGKTGLINKTKKDLINDLDI